MPSAPRAASPSGGAGSAGTVCQAGDPVTYGGAAYRGLQTHQAQPGREPPNTPALRQRR
ncbi:carbohydrate-binding protein [Streptomyces sp. NPDC058299]|uniref:carbohydrate-binding protein n=1 Tax=unclassified Streptomyces TaxID=2593676 RepID=UPI0036ECA942